MRRQQIVKHIKATENIVTNISIASNESELNNELEQLHINNMYFDSNGKDCFTIPMWKLQLDMDKFREEFPSQKIKSAFKTARRSVLSLVTRYLKGIKRGLLEFDQE